MKRKIYVIMLIVMAVVMLGCESKWEKISANAKVVEIKIVGAGGLFSPSSVRIWVLDNGMTISMSSRKNENVCAGDTVAKYKCVKGGNRGLEEWKIVSK